jgi:hypothetical protein
MLREPASYMTRSLKMFEAVAKLSTTAERPELAITAQKNADQLRDLEAQFAAKLAEVIKTRDNAQSRIELGDLAAAAGNPEVARTIYLLPRISTRHSNRPLTKKCRRSISHCPCLCRWCC